MKEAPMKLTQTITPCLWFAYAGTAWEHAGSLRRRQAQSDLDGQQDGESV
jgi:hypothetical protein